MPLVGAYAALSGFGYRAALDGATAIKQAHERVPDAIILDLMLPDIDGFEVCRRLRNEEDTRTVPIIILSALAGENDKQLGRECGANDYLTKPFDPDHLMRTMMRYVGGNEQALAS